MMDIVNVDLSHDVIEKLFFKQMKSLSLYPRKAGALFSCSVEEEKESDLYDEGGINKCIDDDCLSINEGAFMKGYIDA